MKFSETWLREWVDPDLDSASLAHRLTMLGHEVDSVTVDGDGIADVVIAEVAAVSRHPDADKLSLCKVDDGSGELIDVVCGAPNVIAGMKAAFARPGVRLPNGMKLRKAKIRGVVSNGMLCSAVELGLGEESDGILSLASEAPVGTALVAFLGLPDAIIDVDLTPNRGDCFSVLGIARDVAALTGSDLQTIGTPVIETRSTVTQSVELPDAAGCPRFAGRVITGIDCNAKTPIWMTEKLRRAGLRPISPVVDITNFVMLELGQPLHAYDQSKLNGSLCPRLAVKGESITLLDGKELDLLDDTMVITDKSGVIGLAGIMGGLSTAVTDDTTDVFFEAAFWPPAKMAGRARNYGLHTDASLRFERGVDPGGQARAVDRATELLLGIAGGEAGPIVDERHDDHLPKNGEIMLRRSRLERLLGLVVEDQIVSGILQRLQMTVTETEGGWSVTAPSHRFDIEIEADLIEEVARIHGYDEIPESDAHSAAPLRAIPESIIHEDRVAEILIARDFQEAINYSFIDADSDKAFTGKTSNIVLQNPISSEMSVMRGSLLPGLVTAAAANNARQQDRVRLFEISKTFHGDTQQHTEVLRISGIATGSRHDEQWSDRTTNVDFFDMKSDVEAILSLAADSSEIEFVAARNVAMQPGQTANIVRGEEVIGCVGKLHPTVAKQFDLKRDAYIFELDAKKTLATSVPSAKSISKFPAIRRDIAVIVDESVTAHALMRAIEESAPNLIQGVRIFDIYRGDGIEAGRKSVAIGLILQETSRTLTDDDADGAMAAAIAKLQDQFAAVLRD